MVTQLSMKVTAAILVASCAAAIGCTGKIGSPGGDENPGLGAPGSPGNPGGTGTPGIGTGTGGTTGTGGITVDPTQPVAHLHKLTASEFANSVHDLLGSKVPLTAVEPDTVIDGFATVGGSSVSMSPAGVGLYEAAIDAAAQYVFSDATRVTGLLSCIPQATTDAACTTKAVQAFGRRAFRRPLTDVETSRFVDIATSIGDEAKNALTGLQYAVSAILQSPSFLYRVELGAPSADDGGRLKYSNYEMTSRLSSALWNTVPDDALLAAADKGELATADGVRAQAERMLSGAKAHDALVTFVDDLYGVDRLLTSFKDAAVFPEWTPTLQAAMHQELTQRVDDMVFTAKGDYLSLYDNKTVFVNNELAKIYGLPQATPDVFRKVDLPANSPRVGLIGSAGFLAAYALPQRTSPTARGKFVDLTFLCKVVPPPPPGVDPTLPPAIDPTASVRQRLETHRSNASCASCHSLMDPIGLGLENFDSLGRYRDNDNGHPIDASGVVNGAPFKDAAELGTRLRQDPEAASCFVSKVYAHAQGRSPIDADGKALDGLATQFGSAGNRADQLLVEMVSSEAFRFVEPSTL
jgi:hypothetical protein